MAKPVQDLETPEEEDDLFSERWHAPMDGKRVSLEEYWERWYEDEGHYEWNNGTLEAKPMPNVEEHNLYVWFVQLLDHFLRPQPTYQMVGLETGFELHIPDPDSPGSKKTVVRKPDVGIIVPDNPVRMEKKDRTYHGTLDICVECVSKSSKRMVQRDTVVKKGEYLAGEIREYYILDPEADSEKTHTCFFRRTKAGAFVEITPDKNGIIHSVEMPGFRFRQEHLTKTPSMDVLIADPIYDFVTPKTRAEIKQKDKLIAEKDQALAEKDETLAKKDETIAKLQAELERIQSQREKPET